MARQGSIQLSHGAWYLRVYVGKTQRRFLLGYKRDFMSKKAVREAADRKLMELRLVSTGSMARITLDSFISNWYLPVADGSLRPSTAKGYRGVYARYVKGRTEAKKPLWEYKTRDVQYLLAGIAEDNNLSRETLKHVKAFLSGVFRHSIVAGFREGNPVRDAIVPKSAKPTKTPGVYTLAEVNAVLPALSGPARAAVAIAAFAGLRLAEIQALTWPDYDGETLSVKQTQWRGHVSDPKSKASKSWVPVVPALRAVLDEYKATVTKPRTKWVDNGDGEGLEVPDDSMFPVSQRGGRDGREPMDLDHVGRRVVAKAFRSKEIEWKGWHAFRRGLASTLFELGCDDLTVQRILRHAKVTVTREHYIRVRDPKVEFAMKSLSEAIAKEPDPHKRVDMYVTFAKGAGKEDS
jgi:integrase